MSPPDEPTTITAYRDGPLLVRGPLTLVGPDGTEIPIRRRTIALCRCGRSRMGALCDGTHRATGFRAPEGLPEDGEPG